MQNEVTKSLQRQVGVDEESEDGAYQIAHVCILPFFSHSMSRLWPATGPCDYYVYLISILVVVVCQLTHASGRFGELVAISTSPMSRSPSV
jgi:hypothetical protein